MHAHPIPRKRFGQHFLHDKAIIKKIVEAIDPLPSDCIVEIGPGQGALTLPVLRKTGKLTAIELDRDLIPALTLRCANHGLLTLYQADALTFDFNTLSKEMQPLRIIGNLPYNISTPLLFHLLQYATNIKDMHFMLQKEVVQRLAAKPREEGYGRLSVMIQYHAEVFALFDIPPTAFYPPPSVQSAMVRLVPHINTIEPAQDYPLFSDIVRTAFSHRRKTLRNALKNNMTPADWEGVQVDPRLRPEELAVSDYIKISNYKAAK